MPIIRHEEELLDRAAMLAMRGVLAIMPGLTFAPDGRPAFETLMAGSWHAAGVDYTAGVVGGVAGWWCRPADARGDRVMLYHHGGAYVMGSAAAYRSFVGHIAARAGMAAFVADYPLAPETPFPAAFDQACAAYRGLLAAGHRGVVLAGDSAGGGLTLAVLAALAADGAVVERPLAAIVMSPWIDLALGGDSIAERAGVDPLLTWEGLAGAAAAYLGGHDPGDPRACALAAPMRGLPPVQIHVGENEILSDDATRYAAAVERAGGTAELHVWEGMIHVFPVNVTLLAAARRALELMGAFAASALPAASGARGGSGSDDG